MSSSVYLRAFEPDDYKTTVVWRNNKDIQEFMPGTFRYISSEREKIWLDDKIVNNQTDIYLAVCVNDESHKMIGYATINNIDYISRNASLGLVIGEKEHQDGISAIETFILLLDYVFGELNMHRIYGFTMTKNKNALILPLSLGFSIEGEMRDSVYKNGVYQNKYISSILRAEYKIILDAGNYKMTEILKRIRLIRKEL